MKKAALFTILALGMLGAQGQNIEFAEASFYQDSIDPMTIHMVCKAKCQMYIDFAQDGETIIWGDGTQSLIPLVDTTFQYPGLIPSDPLKTYEISHTYPASYADSTVYIGMYMADGLYATLSNAINDPEYMSLCPMVAINFAYMSNRTGIKPPAFPAFTFPTDTSYHILYFYPSISYDTSYTLDVQMVWPVYYYPNGFVGGILLLQYDHMGSFNVTTLDSSNGNLIWNHPVGGAGAFMVSYVSSLYKNGVFVCSMTRDFMIEVFDTSSTPSGISTLSANSGSLHIYPNPSTDKIFISSDFSNYSISISDVTGQSWPAVLSGNEIDVSALPAGVYCLRIQDSSGSVVRKFVKE